jgi:hypothetical protein
MKYLFFTSYSIKKLFLPFRKKMIKVVWDVVNKRGNRSTVPEPAVLDVLWGGNMKLTRRNQEVWPHAPYVVQS